MPPFAAITALRTLLAIPLAMCLVAVIMLDNPLYRALAVAVLVFVEILRDALSIHAAATEVAAVRKKK